MGNDKPDTHIASVTHPLDADLVDYLNGRLVDPACESIQEHLVVCDQCLELFKDMRNFFDGHRPDEQLITADIASEWRGLWNRIQEEPLPHQPADIPVSARLRPGWEVMAALAATLLLVFGLSLWALSQRRQKQELAARLEGSEKQTAALQIERAQLEGRVKQSEQEKLELQERTRQATESRATERPNTSTAELNVPIYDLYARNFSRRSGGEIELNRIKAPAKASSLVLILNGEGLASSPSYRIEILSEKGRPLWRGKGLLKGHLGNLTVTVDRTLLPNGSYSLRLFGQEGASVLAEYLLRIE
jgi:flagellar motor protein MotB